MISNSNDHEGMDHPAWKILPEHIADDPLCSDEKIPSSSSAVLYIMTGKELVSDKDGDCLRYSSENTTPEDFTAVEANQHSCCGIVAASSLQSAVKASTGAPDMAPQAEHLLWNVGAAGVSASGASETEWGKEKAGLIMATEAEGLATSMASTTKADVEILADSSQQGAPKDNPLPNESFQDITFKDDDAANAATTNDDITSTVELTESLKAIGAGKEWVLKFLTTALPEQHALRGLGMEETRDASISASEVEEAGEPAGHAAEDAVNNEAPVLSQYNGAAGVVGTDAARNVSLSGESVKDNPQMNVEDVDATKVEDITIVDKPVPTEAMKEEKEEFLPSVSEDEKAGEPTGNAAENAMQDGAPVFSQYLTAMSSEVANTDAAMLSASANISLPGEPVEEIPLKDVDDLHPATTAEGVTMVDELVPTETMEEEKADLAKEPSLTDGCATAMSMSSVSEVEEAGEPSVDAAEDAMQDGAPVFSQDHGAAGVVGTEAARNVNLSGEPVKDNPQMNVEDVDATKVEDITIVDKPVPTEAMKEEKEEPVPSVSEDEKAGEPTGYAAENAMQDGAPVFSQYLTAISSEVANTDAAILPASANISLPGEPVEEIPLKDVDDLHPATTAGSVTIVDELVPTETMEE